MCTTVMLLVSTSGSKKICFLFKSCWLMNKLHLKLIRRRTHSKSDRKQPLCVCVSADFHPEHETLLETLRLFEENNPQTEHSHTHGAEFPLQLWWELQHLEDSVCDCTRYCLPLFLLQMWWFTACFSNISSTFVCFFLRNIQWWKVHLL